MTVEHDPRRTEPAKNRDRMGDQITKNHIERSMPQDYRTGQVRHTDNRPEGKQSAPHLRGEEVAVDAYCEGSVSGLVKTPCPIVMRSKEDDVMASGLKLERSVNDQTLGAADAEIRVEQCDAQR